LVASGRRGARTLTPITRYGILSHDRSNVSPEKNANSDDGAAPGAAAGAEKDPTDPDLELVVERWSELPEPVKAAIAALVWATDQ